MRIQFHKICPVASAFAFVYTTALLFLISCLEKQDSTLGTSTPDKQFIPRELHDLGVKTLLGFPKSVYRPASTINRYTAPSTLRILFWTSFFGKDDFWFGLGHEPFVRNRCTVHECETTTDKTSYNGSHAIVIHMRDISGPSDVPAYRFPKQKWIFFLHEPPHNLFVNPADFNKMFNVTMTYRRDSDVIHAYGAVGARNKPYLGNEKINFVRGKTRLIAWMASNCKAPSKRMEYVRDLARFVPVDIFGKCGQLKCNGNACYKTFSKKYKFYLSFENNFCKDYATEKLWMILQGNTVPVVLGGANYSDILPSGSYINVRDFSSPEHLAGFLKKLDRNDRLYNTYFSWKTHFKSLWPYHTISFCSLCQYLHENYLKQKVYGHLENWWNNDKDCQKPKDFFRGVADMITD